MKKFNFSQNINPNIKPQRGSNINNFVMRNNINNREKAAQEKAALEKVDEENPIN